MAVPALRDQFPRYLLGKHQLVMTVMSAAFFSLALLLLTIPFSQYAWFRLGYSGTFVMTVVFYLIALAVVAFSKVGQHQMKSAPSFTVGQYILWDIAEVVSIALLYTLFSLEGGRLGLVQAGSLDVWRLFMTSAAYATVSLGIPYIIVLQYFAIEEKDNTIRLMSYGEVVSDTPIPPSEERRITLFDNSGALKFSISPDSLYLIESDDNYIQVWYTGSSGEMRKYMLRCRLKTVEESFVDSDLVRCHRKYIINIRKVRILSSGQGGYSVDMQSDAIPRIPVSKTYEQAVLSRFNSRN